MHRRSSLVVRILAVALLVAAPAVPTLAQEMSANDIVKALTPKAPGVTRSLGGRGIAVSPAEAQAAPSIDMRVQFAYDSADLENEAWAKFDGTLTTDQLAQLDRTRANEMVQAYSDKLKMSQKQAQQINLPALNAVVALRQIRSKSGLTKVDRDTQSMAVKAAFRKVSTSNRASAGPTTLDPRHMTLTSSCSTASNAV